MNRPQPFFRRPRLSPRRGGAIRRTFALLALSGPLSLGAAACAAPHKPPSHLPEGAVVVPYDAHGARLFDDVIEPNAIGLIVSSPSRANRGLLHERTQLAHAVARVRVQTLTADLINGVPTYHLVLAAVGQPLARAALPEGRAEVDIGPTDPGFGIVKSFETQLVGRSFVGFFRWFSAGDEPRLRFHLSADDPGVVDAVLEAALASEPNPG